jgi:hypothetical protein
MIRSSYTAWKLGQAHNHQKEKGMSDTIIPGSNQPQNEKRPIPGQSQSGEGPDNFDRFQDNSLSAIARETQGGELQTNLIMPDHPTIDPVTLEVDVEKRRPLDMSKEQWNEYRRLKDNEARRTQAETSRGRWRKWGWKTAAGAAAVASLTAIGVNALSDDNPKAVPGSQPTATAPVKPGTSTSPNVSIAPPSATATETDPEAEASKAAKAEADANKAEHAAFDNNPFNAETFKGLLPSQTTLDNFAKIHTFLSPNPSDKPNREALTKQNITFEDVSAVSKELTAAFKDGSIAKAIATSNEKYHTNYKPDDFFISPDEVPAARTEANKAEVAAFLAKVVHINQMFLTLAVATRNADSTARAGTDESTLPSAKFIRMSTVDPAELPASYISNGILSNLRTESYTPDTVIPSSTLLITDAGVDSAYNGQLVAQATKDQKMVTLPMLGIAAHTRGFLGSVTEGQPPYISSFDSKGIGYYILVPVPVTEEVSGRVVAVPVRVGGRNF